MPDDQATVIDAVSPGAYGQPVQAGMAGAVGATAHPANDDSAAPGSTPTPSAGDFVSRALSADVTTDPKPSDDTGDPTGQIPALNPDSDSHLPGSAPAGSRPGAARSARSGRPAPRSGPTDHASRLVSRSVADRAGAVVGRLFVDLIHLSLIASLIAGARDAGVAQLVVVPGPAYGDRP